jgi:protein ImuB
VTGRHLLTADPAQVVLAGRPARAVRAWAGPWPADERWWSPAQAGRQARLQVVLDGAEPSAFLLAIQDGDWRVEGVYD